MAPKRKEFSPEQIAEGRRRYELTDDTVDSIAAFFGLGRTRMHQKIAEWGWVRRRYTVPPSPPQPSPASSPPPPTPEPLTSPPTLQPPLRDPVALGKRLQQVVERELDVIDRVLAALRPETPGEAERSARTLASLARSLREVSHINDADNAAAPEAADDAAVPRDLDQLRRDVGRRLDQIIAEAKTLFAEPGE